MRAALLFREREGAGAISTLIRGAVIALLIGVATRFISFPVNIVLARSMGAEEFGIFTYVGTWGFLVGLLALLGMDSGLKRFVAAYRATDKTELLVGIVRRSILLGVTSSVLLGALVLLLVALFHEGMSRSLLLTVIVAAVSLPLFTAQELQVAALVALKRFAMSQLLSSLVPSVLIGLGVGVLYLLRGDSLRSYEVYLLSVLSTGILLITGTWLIRRALSSAERSVSPAYRTREWLRVSLPMFIVDGIREIMNRSDIILIGLLVGTTPAGIYVIALNLARFTSYGLQATTTPALPLIAELHALGKQEELQRMFIVACWASTLASSAIAIVVLLAREPLLGLFGAEFQAASAVLVILIAGRAVDAWTGPNGSLLNMTGHQDLYAVILTAVALINAVLSYPAILLWGVEGAAMVTGFSLVLKNVLVWIAVKKTLNINASIFGPIPYVREYFSR